VRSVSVAVIGTGRAGRVHAENLARMRNVRLAAVCDPLLDEQWVSGVGAAHVSRDADEVFADRAIEAVVIAAPTREHLQLIRRAAAAGKQIFCEKPVAFDPAGVAEAVAAARDYGVMLQIGFNRRFDPTFRRVRERIAAGEIGEPNIVHVVDRDPRPPARAFLEGSGGIFRDLAIHDFDMVRYLTGREVVEVYALGMTLDGSAPGEVDAAFTTLRLDNGALAQITNSRHAVYCYDQRVEVLGSRGSVAAGNVSPSSTVVMSAAGVRRDAPFEVFSERFAQAFAAELHAFVGSVAEGREPEVGGADALAAMRIACAAETSLCERRPVAVADSPLCHPKDDHQKEEHHDHRRQPCAPSI
jgi:myo-inositol 2-dehydrogenase/D-chiro-inositol 1-dehydrogenase